MNKAIAIAAPLVALALALAVSAGLAFDDAAPAVEEPSAVVLTGENYCLLRTLLPEEAKGANATYAQMHALRVTSAEDEFGIMLPDLEGKTVHYLPTKMGQALLINQDTSGQTVKVWGNLYPNASVLHVTQFEAVQAVDEFSWDEPAVGTMSRKVEF